MPPATRYVPPAVVTGHSPHSHSGPSFLFAPPSPPSPSPSAPSSIRRASASPPPPPFSASPPPSPNHLDSSYSSYTNRRPPLHRHRPPWFHLVVERRRAVRTLRLSLRRESGWAIGGRRLRICDILPIVGQVPSEIVIHHRREPCLHLGLAQIRRVRRAFTTTKQHPMAAFLLLILEPRIDHRGVVVEVEVAVHYLYRRRRRGDHGGWEGVGLRVVVVVAAPGAAEITGGFG